jgi:hypothetical protein
MIRFQRSSRTARGKGLEARQWAKEVTEYINGKHPESNLQVFAERFGDISALVWQADFDDLSALDKYQQSFDPDEGYWALINKATDFFIEGSVVDTVIESL